MSASASSPPAPSAPTDGARLSRRGVERLDLLLLTIEALDLNGGEAMVWTSQQMGLHAQFPNRVELWSGAVITRFGAPPGETSSIRWMPNP